MGGCGLRLEESGGGTRLRTIEVKSEKKPLVGRRLADTLGWSVAGGNKVVGGVEVQSVAAAAAAAGQIRLDVLVGGGRIMAIVFFPVLFEERRPHFSTQECVKKGLSLFLSSSDTYVMIGTDVFPLPFPSGRSLAAACWQDSQPSVFPPPLKRARFLERKPSQRNKLTDAAVPVPVPVAAAAAAAAAAVVVFRGRILCLSPYLVSP